MPPSEVEEVALGVHGVSVRCRGPREVLTRLEAHLPTQPDAGASFAEVTLQRAPPARPRSRTIADQIVERGLVYNRGAHTLVDHHGIASSEYDFEAERGSIRAPEDDDLVELGYLMVHSRLGQELERRGLFRVHASAFAVAGGAAIVLAPSGGGKSTMARAALRHTDASLLADDLVLVDTKGQAWPFPAGIGLTKVSQAEGLGRAVPFPRRHHVNKWILPHGDLGARWASGPTPIRALITLRRASEGPSRLRRSSRRALAAALGRDLVVGLGLPQVIELVARRGAADLPAQLPAAMRRALAASQILRRAAPFELEAADPKAAVEAICAMLRS